MSQKLSVRPIGFSHAFLRKTRFPERFAFPASLASAIEAIHAARGPLTDNSPSEQADSARRSLYDSIMVASGIAFGLLWHEEHCLSSLDLTQVQPFDDVLRHSFDYLGFDYKVIVKSDASVKADIFAEVRMSIDAGKPVLAFGIVGPPECSLICGYDENGLLYGYSQYQSQDPNDLDELGMFISDAWFENTWQYVIITEPSDSRAHLSDIIQRGYKIAKQTYIDGYFAGPAAYDSWVNFIRHSDLATMNEDQIQERFRFHSLILDYLEEARTALARYLRQQDDENLVAIADTYDELRHACSAARNLSDGDWTSFRDLNRREKIADAIRKIDLLDKTASDQLLMWYAKQ